MELFEYLMKELDLEEDLAKQIQEKVKEYHHNHDHHHSHEHREKDEDVTKMIKEQFSLEQIRETDLKDLHCNGCENNCSLNEPQCGRGRRIVEMLKQNS